MCKERCIDSNTCINATVTLRGPYRQELSTESVESLVVMCCQTVWMEVIYGPDLNGGGGAIGGEGAKGVGHSQFAQHLISTLGGFSRTKLGYTTKVLKPRGPIWDSTMPFSRGHGTVYYSHRTRDHIDSIISFTMYPSFTLCCLRFREFLHHSF